MQDWTLECLKACILDEREDVACGCIQSFRGEFPLYLVHRAGEKGMMGFLYALYLLKVAVRPNRVIASMSARVNRVLNRSPQPHFQPFPCQAAFLTEADLVHWTVLSGDRASISSLIKQFPPQSAPILIESLLNEGLEDLLEGTIIHADPLVIFTILSHGTIALAVALVERTKIAFSPNTPKALRSYRVVLQLISMLLDSEAAISALYLLSLVERLEWTKLEVDFLLETLRKVLLAGEIDSNPVVNCINPLLFCIAVTELSSKLAQFSLRHKDHFTNFATDFLLLAEQIQGKFTDYRKLKTVYMDRAYGPFCLFDVITGKTEKYRTLLKSDIVAAIVQDLWTGGESERPNFYHISAPNMYFDGWENGLFTLHSQYWRTSLPRSIFKLCFWKKNGSLRFFLETLMLVGLCAILISQIEAYLAAMKIMDESEVILKDDEASFYMKLDLQSKLSRVILVNSGTLVLNILQKITYKSILKEQFRPNFSDFLSIVVFCSSLSINLISFDYFVQQFTFQTNMKVQEYLYATLTFALCLRMSAILTYTLTFGPWIRMVFIITKDIVVFLLLYLVAVLSFALTYAVLFRRDVGYFGSVQVSVRTLFQWSVAGIDSTVFTEREELGSVLAICWAFVSTIILLNLLIAVLSSRYEALYPQVTADYVSLMYQSYTQTRYSEPYGGLVVAPAPLNFLTVGLIPIYILWPGTAPYLNPTFVVLSYQVWFAIGSILFLAYSLKTAFVAYIFLLIQHFKSMSLRIMYRLPLWILLGPFYLLGLVCLSYARFVKEMYTDNCISDLPDVAPEVLAHSKRFLESLCSTPALSWFSLTDLETVLARLPRAKSPFTFPPSPSSSLPLPHQSAPFREIADRIYFSKAQLLDEKARNILRFFKQFASENQRIDAQRMKRMIGKYSGSKEKLAAVNISAVQSALIGLRKTCFDPTD